MHTTPPCNHLGHYQVAPLTTGAAGYARISIDHIQTTKKAYPYWNRKALKVKGRSNLHWVFKKGRERQAKHYLEWSSHLLITAGQDNSTARLTATASEDKYLGQTWFPVVGLAPDEAKAVAVFTNSTPGRLQIMRGTGKKLTFPTYSPRATNDLRVPDIKDERIRQTLADCWERTKDIPVPQFRDGECRVRLMWDEAVSEAMGWDPAELARLRGLLNKEPHVRGLGYNQYADEVDDYEALSSAQETNPVLASLRQEFAELVATWRAETAGLSSPRAMAGHPAYQQIITLGEPVIPLILQDMKDNGGWWYPALRALTGQNPVPESAKGSPPLNDEAWLQWGAENGYV